MALLVPFIRRGTNRRASVLLLSHALDRLCLILNGFWGRVRWRIFSSIPAHFEHFEQEESNDDHDPGVHLLLHGHILPVEEVEPLVVLSVEGILSLLLFPSLPLIFFVIPLFLVCLLYFF